MRSKKELAVELSKLEVFGQADPKLEQYPTPSEIAAELLWGAAKDGDIAEHRILDLGAGTGILGIGALLLGAKHVTFIEQDPAAVKILTHNLRKIQDKYKLPGRTTIIVREVNLTDENADTIIMNPPFGTRTKHADTRFLDYASTHAPITYTFHKTSTIKHLEKYLKRLGKNIVMRSDFKFPLRATMPHHKKKQELIDVTLLLIK